jgi:hypothetical protein
MRALAELLGARELATNCVPFFGKPLDETPGFRPFSVSVQLRPGLAIRHKGP